MTHLSTNQSHHHKSLFASTNDRYKIHFLFAFHTRPTKQLSTHCGPNHPVFSVHRDFRSSSKSNVHIFFFSCYLGCSLLAWTECKALTSSNLFLIRERKIRELLITVNPKVRRTDTVAWKQNHNGSYGLTTRGDSKLLCTTKVANKHGIWAAGYLSRLDKKQSTWPSHHHLCTTMIAFYWPTRAVEMDQLYCFTSSFPLSLCLFIRLLQNYKVRHLQEAGHGEHRTV